LIAVVQCWTHRHQGALFDFLNGTQNTMPFRPAMPFAFQSRVVTGPRFISADGTMIGCTVCRRQERWFVTSQNTCFKAGLQATVVNVEQPFGRRQVSVKGEPGPAGEWIALPSIQNRFERLNAQTVANVGATVSMTGCFADHFVKKSGLRTALFSTSFLGLLHGGRPKGTFFFWGLRGASR